MLRSLRLPIAALAVLAALSGCRGDEDRKEPAPERPDAYAMNVNRAFELPPPELASALGELRPLGVTAARADAFWESAEPRPPRGGRHEYEWFVTDVRAEQLARAGLRWLPIVAYSTRWASSVRGTDKAAPRDPADFAAYAGALVRRYGPGGDFWRARPELQERPVRQWEIWNEPNLRGFWRPRPDPAAYARLYAEARAAIREADPDAVVVLGGLGARPQHDAEGFVRGVLDARPELRGELPDVGFHPYGEDARQALERLDRFASALGDLGLGEANLHLTELGFTTRGVESVSEERRDDEYRALLAGIERVGCRVAQVAPYTWVTPRRDPADREDWYGLLLPSGPSEAARVYGDWVTRRPLRACPEG